MVTKTNCVWSDVSPHNNVIERKLSAASLESNMVMTQSVSQLFSDSAKLPNSPKQRPEQKIPVTF